MRNAKIQDVEEAKRTGVLKEDVMYGFNKPYPVKVHGKRISMGLASCLSVVKDNVVAETADGVTTVVSLSLLYPLSTGPKQEPKKPKRKPVKGTKPFKEVPYDPKLIKVGVSVRCRDGKVRKVTSVRKTAYLGGLISLTGYSDAVYLNTGKADTIQKEYFIDIMSILVQEPEHIVPSQPVQFHKIGDRYERNGTTYILANTDSEKAAMVSLDCGNRWKDSEYVEFSFFGRATMISHEDFLKVADENFVKVS